ncbi:hypothetical protein [Yersinia artesiana]|uniref:hypothetical protein n=1 Tax=Yersinia artesiana TaxID=2890315 RepID=UPI0015814C09|nr:hypothetical protein [Yersinia artesiana]
MAKPAEPYRSIIVESYLEQNLSGKRGKVHIRPIPGQWADVTLQVECAKRLSKDYPVGTQFKIQAKLTDRDDGGEYLYSSFRWEPDEIILK